MPASPRRVRLAWRASVAAWALAAIAVTSAASSVALLVSANGGAAVVPSRFGAPGGELTALTATVSVTMVVLLTLVGGLLASRRARNPIGWIVLGCAVAISVFFISFQYAISADARPGPTSTLGLAAAWVGQWLWLPPLGVFLGFPLLFPTGRLPSPRWRPVAWGAAGSLAALTALLAVVPVPLEATGAPNPLGIAALSGAAGPGDTAGRVLLPTLATLALASLCVRYRRADAAERAQLRWVLSAVVLLAVASASQQVLVIPERWRTLPIFVAACTVPVAVAVAVLRYRLYAIDRIISRTVGWALVTGLLACVYLGAVVAGTSAVAAVGVSGDLAVATATLATAAAFRPARLRIQSAVDRRFDRARYDAAAAVTAFGERLRGGLAPDRVPAELEAAVEATVGPSDSMVWLALPRRGGGGPGGTGSVAAGAAAVTGAVTVRGRPGATTGGTPDPVRPHREETAA